VGAKGKPQEGGTGRVWAGKRKVKHCKPNSTGFGWSSKTTEREGEKESYKKLQGGGGRQGLSRKV